MRTKNFAVSIEKLESCDLHTGTSLWRKYKEIRLVLLNEYKPLLSKHLPNGHPPSGKSFGEVLQTVRKVLYEKSEDVAIKKSKAAGGHPRKPFSPSWYPAEWDVFTMYGAASQSPEEALNGKLVTITYNSSNIIVQLIFDSLHFSILNN